MIKFPIPLINDHAYFYFGKEEWPAFQRKAVKVGMDPKYKESCPEGSEVGRTVAAIVWVCDPKDHRTILHECSHMFDHIYEHVGMEKEDEFKAYMFENMMMKIIKKLLT